MDKLKKFLSRKLGVQEQYITPEKTLEDLGADSLDKIEILMDFYEEFKIKNVKDEEVAKAKTVQDLYLLIKEKTSVRDEETL